MDLEWDSRNVMRLCHRCHRRHTNRSKPLPLTALFPTHFVFAFYVLGFGAYGYLRQKYAGEDPRLDQHLAKWEEEHG
jgi:hypothetical protein